MTWRNAAITATAIAGTVAVLAQHPANAQSPATLASLAPADRGGLEVSTLRMMAGTTPISTLMYRAPDGTIEQFLFSRR